ncbi:coagulation factor V [Pelobates cultripes]|uniref:Coagulation factor V n=1 Tax=Pelobates cultripes TaxID=61616 RepID=A0AAD1VMN6_PELCU|nr:coagulation factor V [Pelobates cultripes]CAH2220388.1 coagulation factor V [Pelobates cultripes]CAH2220389.1 coagulation factor V [Pelobates cultripes]CAH2220390.1 coagulation factor V [Pelobates cultripes]CAH2220392.1 coagulation factor V [Pelobates cultripes]
MDPGKHPSLLLLLMLGSFALYLPSASAVVREHYVAAVFADWNYQNQQNQSSNFIYKKLIYREYEAGFKREKTVPAFSGILGPTLRAEVGDTLKIHFKNLADKALTIHPQGIQYGKRSEGSEYADRTSGVEKMDDNVEPGQTYTYNWDISENVGPKETDPFCLTYIYYSHEDMVQDLNSGLIGPLLICKNGSLNIDGTQKFFNKEYILMFAVFDESKGFQTVTSKNDGMLIYTVNGYANGTMPDMQACVGDTISWHIIAMSSKPEIFSVHFFGQSLEQNHHRVSVIGLVGSSSTTANMTVSQSGRWLITSLIHKHIEAGMHCYIDVKTCSGKVSSVRRLSNSNRRYIKVWEHYIAAEEISWDYHTGDTGNRKHCPQKYKKVVYKEYTDKTFTARLSKEEKLFGPVIRAQVRDTIMVVFKNMASKPYSIYPHGVSIHKDSEGANYPPDLKGAEIQDQAVMPGDIRTYHWTVLDTDEPTKNDSQCLTRMYHSAVNIHRDIASGLVGPLLICKSMSLNTRGAQEKADQEQIATFAVYDENLSWYREENQKACSKVNSDYKHEYNSNVIQTINGNAVLNSILGFCHGQVTQWHVSSIGVLDEIISVYITGHLFRNKRKSEDVINVFPMSSESVTVEMDNQGVWLFGTFSFSKKKEGLKMRFRDVKCEPEFNEYEYEDIFFNSKEITQKDSLETSDRYPIEQDGGDEEDEEREGEDDAKDKSSIDESDDYSDHLASMFLIRSLRNNTGEKGEELNFTALDIEDMESTLIENVSNSTRPSGFKKNASDSSDEQSKVEENSLEHPENISSEVNKAMWIEGPGNKTSIKINGEFNKTNMLDKEAIELFSIDDNGVGNEELLNNRTEEHQNITTMADMLNSIGGGTESPVFVLVDNSNHLEEFPEKSINKNIDGEIQSFILFGNNSDDIEVKTMVKRHIPYETENTTYVYLDKNDIPEKEAHELNFQSKIEKNYSDNVMPQTFKTMTPVSGLSNDSNQLPIKTLRLLTENKQSDFIDHHTTNLTLNSSIYSTDRSSIEVNTNKFIGPEVVSPTRASRLPSSGPDDFVDLKRITLTHPSRSDLSNTSNFENLDTKGTPTYPSYSTSQGLTIDHEVDFEFKEMFGDKMLDDIMKAIYYSMDTNETVEETNNLALEEKNIDGMAGLLNESLTLSSNKTNQEHFIINQETMKENQTRELHGIRNPTGQKKIRSVLHREKKDANVPGKRTGHQKFYSIKNDSSEIHELLEVDKEVLSNISVRSSSGKPALSPRGQRPEIIIGVSRTDDDSYTEYDYGTLFEDVSIPAIQYILYENPYEIHNEDDIERFTNPDVITERYLRSSKGNKRNYYIAAVEIQWEYSGSPKSWSNAYESQTSQTRQTQFTKVVFREYTDSTFQTPEDQSEYEEHLGILGPVIRAEVGDVIKVTFKNLASRPYSLHAHGVSYEKSSEGFGYDDETSDWLKKDDIVQPGEKHVYVWHAQTQSGPEPDGLDCRAWAYYSAVNPERDLHSGLIGPLLVCKNGTLDKYDNRPLDIREFILLFMTFEEEKSWYFEKNDKKSCTEVSSKQSGSQKCFMFHAINGVIYNLQGLQMYENKKVIWHLLNMGGPKDVHVVHFHGQTFIENINKETQHGIYPLLPGSFATVEMVPSRAGLWLVDTEVAEYQQAGMQAMFQISDSVCNTPLGMESRAIQDHQITAQHYIDYWEPKLARLNNGGAYNAWSANMNRTSLPWIQIDFQKQLLITGIMTQGASKYFTQYYTREFVVMYSKDRKKWIGFKGNSTAKQKFFEGNTDSSSIKENSFDPPIAARFIRIYPIKFNNRPTLRLEFLGCEIQGCSVPLGMENNLIKDEQITASSYKQSWYKSWKPTLARLNNQGSVNAWQAKSNNNQQWLQINFLQTKKITAIATQGVKSLGTEMFVKTYTIHYSENGKDWIPYMDQSISMEKIFKGNVNNNGHVKNDISPPIFSRFLKIIPKSWSENIALRVEVFGCDA